MVYPKSRASGVVYPRFMGRYLHVVGNVMGIVARILFNHEMRPRMTGSPDMQVLGQTQQMRSMSLIA